MFSDIYIYIERYKVTLYIRSYYYINISKISIHTPFLNFYFFNSTLFCNCHNYPPTIPFKFFSDYPISFLQKAVYICFSRHQVPNYSLQVSRSYGRVFPHFPISTTHQIQQISNIFVPINLGTKKKKIFFPIWLLRNLCPNEYVKIQPLFQDYIPLEGLGWTNNLIQKK